MDYVVLIPLLIAFGFGAFIQKYLNRKGENLATKEDITEITRQIEQVKSEYTERLEEIKQQNRLLLEHTQYKNQLRLAALDRRLEVHQQAFALWQKLMDVLYDRERIGEVVRECQDWWVRNNLYLEEEAGQAFRIAYHSAPTYCQIHTELREADSTERQRREGVLSESWKSVNDAGEAIVKAVELPGLVEEEHEPANLQDREANGPSPTDSQRNI